MAAARLIGVTILAATVSGCMVGPDYKRPVVTPPDKFRGDAIDAPAAPSLADERWWQLFDDETLQELIRTALQQNDDLKLAAARILEAQSQLGITSADQYPQVSAGPGLIGQRPPAALGFPSRSVGAVQVQASAAWELDFWGKFRRATESARAELLATEWGKQAIVTTLISQVSSGYLQLRALDLNLDISRRTLDSRNESLQLAQVREAGGVTSLLDVRQAEQLVFGARAEIATLERQIAQQENFLNELLGNNPGPIPRGRPLIDQPRRPEVPAGLPSELLQRRPDIQRAEQELIAANAQIGVARADYFPRIALTGSGGFESTALATLFTGSNIIWSAAASAVVPVVTAGRTKSHVALAEARREEATVAYQQTVRQAFREVSDALVGYSKLSEFREEQAQLFAAAEDARRLAQIRYEGGATSYLEVLDADTRLFAAELDLTQAELQQRSALVEIYRALGGGWQT